MRSNHSSTNCMIIIEIQSTFNFIPKENSNQSHKHSPHQPFILNTRDNVETHLKKTTKVLFIWHEKGYRTL